MNKLNFKRSVLILGLCTSLALVGCGKQDNQPAEGGESVEANAAGMTIDMDSEETFKPSDYTIDAKDSYTYDYMGLKYELTPALLDRIKAKDIAILDDQSPLDKPLTYALFSFNQLTEEQKNAEVDKMGDGYEKWEEGLERVGTLGLFKKGISQEELKEITSCAHHKKLGTSSNGEFEYYLSYKDEDSDFTKEFTKTKVDIIDMKDRPENGFVLAERSDLEGTEAFSQADAKDLKGIETKDIHGKAFSSEDFKDHDLTMVNVFATWCTACIKEIPDLAKLQEEMAAKGVQVVGVVTDTVDDQGENQEAIEKSKVIEEKTKANYPFLMPDSSNFKGRLNGIQALPETFFVDKEGNIVGETYSGSHNFKDWKAIVEKELENVKK